MPQNNTDVRIAVVAHYYYEDIWPEITKRLKALDCIFDLYVTTSPSKLEKVESELLVRFPDVKIRTYDDVGMDILPFLKLIPELIYKDYEAVCKLHTKKGQNEQGIIWRRYLLDSLIGSSENFNGVAQAFIQNRDLQLAGPGALYQSAKLMMYKNRQYLAKLTKKMFGTELPDDDWGFFLGTMFWVRPKTLAKLAYHADYLSDYCVRADSKHDGSVEHAVERLFGMIPLNKGGKVGLYYPPDMREEADPSTCLVISDPTQEVGYVQNTSLLLRNLVTLDSNRIILEGDETFDQKKYNSELPESLKETNVDRLSHYLIQGRYSPYDPEFNLGIECSGYLLPASKEQLVNWQMIDWGVHILTPRDNNQLSIVLTVQDNPEGLLNTIRSVVDHESVPELGALIVVLTKAQQEELNGLGLSKIESSKLRVVNVPQEVLGVQCLNLGFVECSSKYVFYIQSGCCVTAKWFESVLKSLERNSSVNSVSVSCLFDSGASSYLSGGCVGLMSKAFAELRGFDVTLPMELSIIDLGLRNSFTSNFTSWKLNGASLLAYDDKLAMTIENAFSVGNDIFNRRWQSLLERGVLGVKQSSKIGVKLHPQNSLEKSESDESVWIARDVDPFFQLELSGEGWLPAGWYAVDVAVRSTRRRDTGKLYFEHGRGLNEADSWTINYLRGEATRQVFQLSEMAHYVRFDPQEGAGEFSVDTLAIESLEERSAIREMTQAILQQHEKFVGCRPRDLNRYLKNFYASGQTKLCGLVALYNEALALPESDIRYDDWIDLIETPSLPSIEEVAKNIKQWELQPKISVLMPVYNTDDVFLRLCIDSVIKQSYQNWELCIADDASPNPNVRQTLNSYAAKDRRIRVVFRSDNGHISAASNSALKVCSGDYVALLDHDDELAEHAFYYMVEAINKHPEVSILYSDEDKITEEGVRHGVHFKSDWNPDLFFAQNYVSHLGLYRRTLLEKIGGFREGVEGSQDQDLLLRCLPLVCNSQIVHIPRVLYHWRTIEGSTAMDSDQKDYTSNAGVKALQDYFGANGPEGTIVHSGDYANTYKVDFPIPEAEPLVSLLIPTRDRLSLVEVAVRSIIEKSTYKNFEILILDNGSVEQETLDFFVGIQQEDSRVRVLRYDHPFNYSAINNFGAKHAKGSILGLINNDVDVISKNWLTEMVRHCCRQDVGCVGAKLYYSNDTIQHAGVIIGLGGVAGHSHKNFPRDHQGYFRRLMLPQSVSAVTAACLLIRKEIFDEVGGLDEDNLKVAFNDVDFCLKVREAGYRNVWTPYAELYHYESISRGVEDTPEKQARFASEVTYMKNKWGKILQLDPFYSPNLTLDREDFSITSNPQSPYIVE